MEFGVCGAPDVAGAAAQAGYRFCEWSVGALLKPRESEEAFQAVLGQVRRAELPYPVVNCFVPGDLKITGPDVDMEALTAYVSITCTRAHAAGVKVIVFGSGGARQIPDGFDRLRAHEQLVRFGGMVGPLAGDNGVTVVVEPLNASECNVLNTVAEGAAIVREVAHPAFRLLVDAYHLMRDGDSYDDIVANGDLFSHVHLATTTNRVAPGSEPCDFVPFFMALKAAGYDGRVSIEGKLGDSRETLPVALKVMRQASGRLS